MALITGDLAQKGVPELFRAVAEEHRTGRLTLTRIQRENGQLHGQEAHIFFRDGEAYHARLVGSGIRLGDRLISAGLVTQEDIDAALEVQSSEGGYRRLGQVLLDNNQINFEQLDSIVRLQIEDTIFEILRWEGGKFAFDPDLEAEEDIGITVSVENLVMEGARRFREWHEISRSVPSLESIPRFNDDEESGSVEVALTPEEWSFVSRVDGKHTITQLALACGFTDLEAGRTVFGLVTAGLLILDLPAGVEVPSEDPDMEAAFDELEKALQEASSGERYGRSLSDLATVVEERDEEREREEAERAEQERLEAERVAAEAARIEEERAEAERIEAKRVEAEVKAAARAEAKAATKRGEEERLEAERREAARLEAERAEAARLEAERREAARLEAERREAARLEAERREAARLEQDRLEQERLEQDRLEQDRLEQERLEAASLEAERAEARRLEQERLEQERLEQERLERERAQTAEIKIVARERDQEDVEAEAEREFEDYAAAAPGANGSYEVTSVVAAPVTDETTPVEETSSANILAEEKIEEANSRTYVRLFAELSAGGVKEEEKAEQSYPREEQTVDPEPTADERARAARPVDPLVDTNALFREFSALGSEGEGSDLAGFDTGKAAPPQPVEEKGRGFFGRKKR